MKSKARPKLSTFTQAQLQSMIDGDSVEIDAIIEEK
jgi:hypothetical protein